MDPFTERILQRARERQKKLLEPSAEQIVSPLRESNSIKSSSTPAMTSSENNLPELKNSKRKDVVSESNLCEKAITDTPVLRESVSDDSVPKFVRQNSKIRIESPDSPFHLKTLNFHKENLNMEIKLSSVDNVRVEVEFQDESSGDEAKENFEAPQQHHDDDDGGQSILRDDAKKRLQRLGKLYRGGDDANISSPIHRTEETFVVQNASEEPNQEKFAKDTENTSRGRKGLGGLAVLAQNIDQWEDESSMHSKKEPDAKPLKRSWKPPAPRPPISSVRPMENLSSQPSTPRGNKPQAPKIPKEANVKSGSTDSVVSSPAKPKVIDTAPKQLDIDQTLIQALESQGFTRTTSNTRLIYNYDSQSSPNKIKTAEISSPSKLGHSMKGECILEESEPEDAETQIKKTVSQTSIDKTHETKSHITPRSPAKTTIKSSAIANKAAFFESSSSPNKNNSSKDPALLSVSERKALFEKNKGAAPVPKAPISMATPAVSEKVVSSNQTNYYKSKSPTKGEKSAVLVSTNRSPGKYPAPRPPIRPKDDADSASAYRVAPGEPGGIASKMAALFKNKTTISQQQIESSIREQRQKEMDVLLNRFQKNKQALEDEKPDSESESESDNGEITETTAMIHKKPAQIVKVTELSPPPPPPPLPGCSDKRRSGGKRCSEEDSPKVTAALDDVKRIKVARSNKPGRLYPCLSDIETATETETENASPTPNNSSFEESYSGSDAGIGDTSFGREVLETVCKNQTPQKRPIFDESTESDLSDVLDEHDDYLDEALAHEAVNESGPTPPKQGRSTSPVNNTAQPSNSFQYKNFSPHKTSPQKHNSHDFKTPTKSYVSRKSDELPVVIDGDKELPLTHTVSFYRRQQTQESKTPVRQIIRPTIIEEPSNVTVAPSKTNDGEVENKIQELLEEMTRQQTIISQTSQALNLCYSTPEFTGSTEQVEAEKVLLLATHRRAASQREMERLTVLKTLHPERGLEKGTLTISNIILPLKREYVRALNATGGKGHHVVCLVKCAEQVHSTKLVSTVATNDRNPNLELAVPGTISLKNVYSNFTVQFEVYCLQAQEEVLPHEVKYHINNKKSSNKMTPKKGKADSRLIRPLKESPGGPQVVRSPTFALMGYVVFSLQAINRKNWTLNNAPSMSPLEGIVEMRVKCEIVVSVQYHGFLTMFEDVSGFGAWHRRWCMLRGHTLSYWKYPDDEKKKTPIDTIDLKNCITQQVGPVRRDICARPNTVLVETTRAAQSQDRDSLIMECMGDRTVIRHLLSADTKDERIEWCTMLNKALAASRIGGNTK